MFRGITRNIWILAWVSLLTDVSSEMLYPLIPIFLTTVLGAPATVVGIIEGVAEGTSALLKVFSGWISDRIGKRRLLVIAGYGASALGKPLLAASFAWPSALFARFVDRFGKGVRTAPRDALLADSADVSVRGRAFGLHRSMDTLGAVIGPLLALGLLAVIGEKYRLIFLLAVIPAVLGVILLFLVKERPAATIKGERLPIHLSFRGLPRNFKIFMAVMALFTLGNSSDVFLLLRAQDFGFSTTLVVLAYVVYNITYSLTAFPAGILSDRIGRIRVIIGGLVIFSAVYLGFAIAASPIHFWLLFAVYGTYQGLTEGVSKAYVADLVPRERRATLLGLYYTVLSLLTFAASFVGGILWDAVSPSATFIFGSSLALLATIIFIVLRPWSFPETAERLS